MPGSVVGYPVVWVRADGADLSGTPWYGFGPSDTLVLRHFDHFSGFFSVFSEFRHFDHFSGFSSGPVVGPVWSSGWSSVARVVPVEAQCGQSGPGRGPVWAQCGPVVGPVVVQWVVQWWHSGV